MLKQILNFFRKKEQANNKTLDDPLGKIEQKEAIDAAIDAAIAEKLRNFKQNQEKKYKL